MRVLHRDDENWRFADPAERRGLPLPKLVRLYLDPFSMAKPVHLLRDPIARAAAMRHNRWIARFIPRYLVRWLVLHGFSWAGVSAAELVQAAVPQAAIASFFGVGVASSFCVMVVSGAAWLLVHGD
jgi:hypothetical protein